MYTKTNIRIYAKGASLKRVVEVMHSMMVASIFIGSSLVVMVRRVGISEGGIGVTMETSTIIIKH